MSKKAYITPKTETATFVPNNILAFSSIALSNRQELKSETQCPFNNKWCVEKQDLLEEWTNVVKSYAKSGKDYMFHTSENMFDGCPFHCKKLCTEYKQRQRD